MGAPLRVWTAQYSYRGDDRLDVTRKSTDPVGIVFAPSEAILRPVLELRHVSESLNKAAELARKNGANVGISASERSARAIEDAAWAPYLPQYGVDGRIAESENAARIIEDAAWKLYVPLYVEEMRSCYKRRGTTWRMVLDRGEVTFCCFCNLKTHPGHCHRLLLAGFFEKLGAQYMGER